MRKIFLTLPIILILPTSLFAADKEEIKLSMEFERMKCRANYVNDLSRPLKEGQLFILWVDCVDLKLYKSLKLRYPDALHSFTESKALQDVQPGVVVGIRRATMVERAKTYSVAMLSTLNAEGVIQNSLSPPPGSSSPGCPGGVSEWTGFRH